MSLKAPNRADWWRCKPTGRCWECGVPLSTNIWFCTSCYDAAKILWALAGETRGIWQDVGRWPRAEGP